MAGSANSDRQVLCAHVVVPETERGLHGVLQDGRGRLVEVIGGRHGIGELVGGRPSWALRMTVIRSSRRTPVISVGVCWVVRRPSG
ncbi:hypothetical protein [Gordonia sp. NPDC003376]